MLFAVLFRLYDRLVWEMNRMGCRLIVIAGGNCLLKND